MYYFPKIESCRVISILTNISLTGLKLCQNFKLSILSVKTYFLLKKKNQPLLIFLSILSSVTHNISFRRFSNCSSIILG